MIGFQPSGMTVKKTAPVTKEPGMIRSLIWRLQSVWVRYDIFMIIVIAAVLFGYTIGTTGKR